jgi:hypothetical protein
VGAKGDGLEGLFRALLDPKGDPGLRRRGLRVYALGLLLFQGLGLFLLAFLLPRASHPLLWALALRGAGYLALEICPTPRASSSSPSPRSSWFPRSSAPGCPCPRRSWPFRCGAGGLGPPGGGEPGGSSLAPGAIGFHPAPKVLLRPSRGGVRGCRLGRGSRQGYGGKGRGPGSLE